MDLSPDIEGRGKLLDTYCILIEILGMRMIIIYEELRLLGSINFAYQRPIES